MANRRKITLLALIIAISVASVAIADIAPSLSKNNLAEKGYISGMVADESGSRLPGATIVFCTPDGEFVDSTVSGVNGTFSVNLPTGGYRISAWATGYIKEYYPNAFFINSSSIIKLFPKVNVQISFSLKRGGAITGHIVTHNNNGCKFTVSALKIDNPYTGWQYNREVVVYDNGEYDLGGLIAGHYKVFIRGEGYQIQYYPMVQNFNGAAIIEIDENLNAYEINFDLLTPAFGFVCGRVMDIGHSQPLSGVSIFASQWSPDSNDPGVCVAQTDENGYYGFEIVTGNYIISARSGGLQLTESEFKIYYDGRFNSYLADIVVVEAGVQVSNIDFNLDLRRNYNLSISGALYDERNGAPITGARMIALDYHSGKALACGTTANSGDFLIDNVPDGTYLIQYSASNLIPAFWPGVWGWQQAEIITVNEGAAELYNGGAITQDYGTPGLSISGRVECPDSALANVRVYAVNRSNDMVAFSRTDNEGFYTITSGLTEGVYTIFADLYGFEGTYYPGIVAIDLVQNPNIEDINIMLIPAVLGADVHPILPQEDRLLPNYPNPFNGGTNILYEARREGQLRFEIYDITGRLCRSLNALVKPGINEIYWDGADNSNLKVASGIYFYRVAGTSFTRKMTLIK